MARCSRSGLLVTCRLDEADALFDEDRDGPLETDHGGQRHPKVVALNGFGDGVSGFGPGFLQDMGGGNDESDGMI